MKNTQNKQIIIGYLCAIIATAIWSGNIVVARNLSDTVPPISLAFWRWVVATVVLLPFAIKPLIKDRKKLKKHLPLLSITSLLGVTIFNSLVYYAGHTTSALNMALISITFPIFIVLLSRIFYKELISLNKGIGIVLVACGVVLLVTKGVLATLWNISFAVGDLWMLTSAVIFAVYSLLVKRKPQNISIWSFQLSTFLLGLIFLFPFYLWEASVTPAIAINTQNIGSILYVGIFASLTAYMLWNKAVVNAGPSKAGMIYYTLPVFSGFTAYFFLGETISLIHLLSITLIFTGIFIANYEFQRTKLSISAKG